VATRRIRDDLGRELVIGAAPRRVVSLVPSDTYSLFALGAGDRVVGRTEFCVEPSAAVARVTVVGGTKSADVGAIIALEPQLVLANQEENGRAAIEALAAERIPVLVSLPRRFADGIAHLARIARILDLARDPTTIDVIRRGYDAARAAESRRGDPGTPAFVPIWMDPLMTLNAETYGSDVVELAGARNVFGDRERLYPLAADLGKSMPRDAGERDVRYPRIRGDEVTARAPSIIVLPDEPHAFDAADAATLSGLAPAARVVHVSGKDLFWSGAWAIDAIERLRTVLHGQHTDVAL
jgi:ABC-type Fe3+-hydroxamate transport system substrate-binding protein